MATPTSVMARRAAAQLTSCIRTIATYARRYHEDYDNWLAQLVQLRDALVQLARDSS